MCFYCHRRGITQSAQSGKTANEEVKEENVIIEGYGLGGCSDVTDEHCNQTFADLCFSQYQRQCNVIDQVL